MNIGIFYHSTTGNTAAVAHYVAGFLQTSGNTVTTVDITSSQGPLGEFDLVGFASPTLYFRGSFTMERFLTNLPPVASPKPAFLFGTCAGEPGAQFQTQGEILRNKGYRTLGAHFVIAPSNWPEQLVLTDMVDVTAPLGRFVGRHMRPLRPFLAFLWPEAGMPDALDRHKLDVFLERMVERASESPLTVPPVDDLFKGLPGAVGQGKKMSREQARKAANIHVIPERCSSCGLCEKLCPEGAIVMDLATTKAQVGPECTGCYTCYHKCPTGAIEGRIAKKGKGKYRGPTKEFKALFLPS